jgi:isoleucyl-tRNA synthetase
MEQLREYVNLGLGIRAKEHQKVRQPLASVTVPTLGMTFSFIDILKDELNVKDVFDGGDVSLDLFVTPELQREGLAREVVRFVQNARKDAGLNVDDRIVVSLTTDNDDLRQAMTEHQSDIAAETLATHVTEEAYDFSVTVKVDGAELTVSLQKDAS